MKQMFCGLRLNVCLIYHNFCPGGDELIIFFVVSNTTLICPARLPNTGGRAHRVLTAFLHLNRQKLYICRMKRGRCEQEHTGKEHSCRRAGILYCREQFILYNLQCTMYMSSIVQSLICTVFSAQCTL